MIICFIRNTYRFNVFQLIQILINRIRIFNFVKCYCLLFKKTFNVNIEIAILKFCIKFKVKIPDNVLIVLMIDWFYLNITTKILDSNQLIYVKTHCLILWLSISVIWIALWYNSLNIFKLLSIMLNVYWWTYWESTCSTKWFAYQIIFSST